MLERTPLHPQIFGRIKRDGYSVEKVLLEALPGYYLGGQSLPAPWTERQTACDWPPPFRARGPAADGRYATIPPSAEKRFPRTDPRRNSPGAGRFEPQSDQPARRDAKK